MHRHGFTHAYIQTHVPTSVHAYTYRHRAWEDCTHSVMCRFVTRDHTWSSKPHSVKHRCRRMHSRVPNDRTHELTNSRSATESEHHPDVDHELFDLLMVLVTSIASSSLIIFFAASTNISFNLFASIGSPSTSLNNFICSS